MITNLQELLAEAAKSEIVKVNNIRTTMLRAMGIHYDRDHISFTHKDITAFTRRVVDNHRLSVYYYHDKPFGFTTNINGDWRFYVTDLQTCKFARYFLEQFVDDDIYNTVTESDIEHYLKRVNNHEVF